MSSNPSHSPSPTEPAATRPALVVAVVMRRERIQGPMSRWQPMRWVLADVVPNEASFGVEPRLLSRTDDEERWLHPGIVVELFRDDAEGYYLNVSTDAPCWFVFWRMEELASVAAEPIARPIAPITRVAASPHPAPAQQRPEPGAGIAGGAALGLRRSQVASSDSPKMRACAIRQGM